MTSPAAGYLASDQAARRRALDPAVSFLVQAPAGSGKTELLIQRFLALLPLVEEPESVIAITFTRKAAGEMQDRILKTLARAQAGTLPEALHEQVSHSLALAALRQDRRRHWNLLDHPARLRIETIDALCLSIARQMPWLARLGALPAVTENAAHLYREAARRTLAQVECDGSWQDPLERVLLHLDNNLPHAQQLVERMLAVREQWLPLVASGEPRREDFERALEAAVRDGLARASALFPPHLRGELIELARFGGRNVEPGHEMAPCATLAGWPRAIPGDQHLWVALTHVLLTGKGDWRKTVNRCCGFPTTDRARKNRVLDLIAALSGPDLAEALALVRVLPPARYSEPQWEVTRALFSVLRLAAGHLKLVFRESGEADFSEIGEGARAALGDSDAPSDLALGLDARVCHLLVDEFQDTSVAQFDLLDHLTAGWQPGDGRTLFLVGDPMQSIYRFRQAEVGLFLKTASGAVGEVRPEFLRLAANHRSLAGLVDRVNEIFARIFPRVPDIGSGAIDYSRAVAVKPAGEGEAVTVHAFAEGADEAEARLVADLVRDARARGTVAVLVRARTHLPAIVAALKRDGTAFRAIDIDSLAERTVVRDLLALTRALLHLADRPSWLAILRAPWCGLTLADLHALVSGAPQAVVWDLLEGDLAALSADGRARAARLREILAPVVEARGRWSVRRWVERAWCALGGPACLASEDDLQDASDYFDLLERHQRAADLPDFDGFRAEVEHLFAQPGRSAAGEVQLMTIHKAKGLQFDTVIVPGLGRLPRQDDSALLLSAERPRPSGGADLLLATIGETGQDRDAVYNYLRVLDKQKSAHECVRLLYVAATRARLRLHLAGSATRNARGEVYPKSGSLLAYLWDGLRDRERQRFFDCYTDAPTAARPAAVAAGVPLRRLPSGWVAPPLPEPVPLRPAAPDAAEPPSYLWVGDTLRHVGTVVHAALERIAAEGAGLDPALVRRGRERYQSALANLGVPPGELEGAVRRVEEALGRTLASPRGRWVLGGGADARSEYAVAGVVDGQIVRGAVDRTFLDGNGTRWIIDYKTSDHRGGNLAFFLDEEQRRYRPQLERYARLLAALGQPVRLGLYFPLLDEWREWSPA